MKMKMIFVILLLCQEVCFADNRGIPYADSVPFLGIEDVTEHVKKAVFAVQMKGNQSNNSLNDDWIAIGSGFLLRGEKGTVLGVTCNHVVSLASKAKKSFFIGLDTEKGYRRFQCDVAYSDPNNDIAIVKPKKQDPNEDVDLIQKYFTSELFDDNSSLVEGRGVIIPGYPLALGIEDDKNHPVVRFGIIAQFTGKNIFLIDGFASHGSSGSPVFAIKYKERRLVGMVTSHVSDTITLFNESGKVSARLPYNSGLARAITMKTILKAIDKAGLSTK